MLPIVRFAPSPTGQVHIGNIRAAIFNWLYAKSQNGKFLLRIEDTDRERSTKEAVDTLLKVMDWLKLNHDEEILYQSTRIDAHRDAAENMIKNGSAVRKKNTDGKGAPVIFILPYDSSNLNFVRIKENVSINTAQNITIRKTGAKFIQLENAKEIERECSLAGLYKLKIYDKNDELLFDLDAKIATITDDTEISISNAAKMEYIRREVFFKDSVKGELSKPLDSMKDFVIVRSDNTPVFHLANVCDDIKQNINFIMRGDDHVENTFRHLFLFKALNYEPPQYAHLPMIVNAAGKPYSKRDGDAYVGDFETKGFLPEALFNYLALLGWSPGDDREKMTRDEMIASFSIDRIKNSPAQFDIQKLTNMNGLYISEMTSENFISAAAKFANWDDVQPQADEFAKIAKLMQSRTKILSQILEWKYFFSDNYTINQKDLQKSVSEAKIKDALLIFKNALANFANPSTENLNELIRKTEAEFSLKKGSLNFPLRIILSGIKSGPPIEDIILALGVKKSSERIEKITTNSIR